MALPVHTSAVAQITSACSAVQEEKSPKNVIDLGLAGHAVGLDHAPAARQPVQGAYLHVPFCFHKCHYCDFYSIVDSRDRQKEFVDRLTAEIRSAAEIVTVPLQTIFVGGGTPTLLAPQLWAELLHVLNQRLPLTPAGEFTVEANPETVTEELLHVLASGGVNRISIGCQSFNPVHLKTLERWHDPASVHRSVALLRAAGIANFNLDLIFAIPGQTLDDWLADLDEALSLKPTHLSCYGLTYESNTPMTVKMKGGQIEPCAQELEAAMYEAALDRLADAGFEHYEISNWARQSLNAHEFTAETAESAERWSAPETPQGRLTHGSPSIQNPKSKIQNCVFRCRHNMIYWTNGNWWPLGPSASGHVNGLRWKNVPRLGEYLEHGPFPPIVDAERVDEDGRIGEAFMLGLRLIEGMENERVDAFLSAGRRGRPRRHAIDRSIEAGLLERIAGRLRLSKPGLLLADTVLAELI